MTEQQHDQSQELGRRLRELRQKATLSMRQLSKLAGVAPSYIAGLEAGRISPTIATLRKMLTALGTDLGEFFTEPAPAVEDYIFRAGEMRQLVDPKRRYVFILPRRQNIHVEIVDETIIPGERPEFETLSSDLAGYVLSGELYLEIGEQERQLLHPYDAYYVPAGTPVRGYCALPGVPVHMVTVYSPARY